MKKNKHLRIRLNDDQDFILRELGGHTKGFETILNFYLDNYDLAEEHEKEIHRQEAIKKLKRG